MSADQQNRSLVVRTSNKKYFKKIEIPELDRVGLLPEQDRISFTHKFNTLIITVRDLFNSVFLIIFFDSIPSPKKCRQWKKQL